MAASSSVITLTPSAKAFVDNRITSLGSWVIAGFIDAIMLGIVLAQTITFFRSQSQKAAVQGLGRYYRWLVLFEAFLSILKTAQSIAIVFVQNVLDYANPDVAQFLVAKAWWQVSTTTLTAITAIVVQSFFTLRFFLLSRNYLLLVPILAAMLLGFAGACLTLNSIIVGNVPKKIMWLLVHLICTFMTDFFITCGTCWALNSRKSGGLASTMSLIGRLMRLVFESALPPTIVAAIDLILTQTLGPQHLLWHLVLNFMLAKLYVISLLFTLNSINEYRDSAISGERVTSSGSRGQLSGGFRPVATLPKRGDLEMGAMQRSQKPDQIYVSTQVITQVSPEDRDAEELKVSGWQSEDWNR